jgi:hypothetical protein
MRFAKAPSFAAIPFKIPVVVSGAVYDARDSKELGASHQLIQLLEKSFTFFFVTCAEPRESP